MKETQIEVGKYYEFTILKDTAYKVSFKIIMIHRKENKCCIVYQNESHKNIKLDDINNHLIKGLIIEKT